MATNAHTVSLSEAETNLSRLIERVLAGEEVVIARDEEPVVRLVREGPSPTMPKKRPLLGAFKGRFTVDDSFLDPLPDEYLGWPKDDD